MHTSGVTGEAWLDTRLLRATLDSRNTTPRSQYRNTAPGSADAAKSLAAASTTAFLMNNPNGSYRCRPHGITGAGQAAGR